MRAVTWNVNSVRARLDGVYHWLKSKRPDVVCLQETKCADGVFPRRELELAGYHAVIHGQKTYNGVAILARRGLAIEDVRIGWGEGITGDGQARLIAATVEGVRFVCAYVPNGQAVGSAKWSHKLTWLERMRAGYLDTFEDPDTPILLCGDFNVARRDEDVHDLDIWSNSILTHRKVRQALENVLDFGFVDLGLELDPEGAPGFTWWDYRRGSFERDRGVRIDYHFATAPLAERARKVWVDREEREKKKPSDHAPVWVEFD